MLLEVEEEKFAREYEEIRQGEMRRRTEEEIGLDIEGGSIELAADWNSNAFFKMIFCLSYVDSDNKSRSVFKSFKGTVNTAWANARKWADNYAAICKIEKWELKWEKPDEAEIVANKNQIARMVHVAKCGQVYALRECEKNWLTAATF